MGRKTIIMLMIFLFLASCSSEQEKDRAALVIEAYLTAMVEHENEIIANLSCTSWEEGALTDVAAYDGVNARLEAVECQLAQRDGDNGLVTCQGSIIANYFGEERPLALDELLFVVKREAGDWRMCGYQ